MSTAAKLIADLSSDSEVNHKDVQKIIEALVQTVAKGLKKNGAFKIPLLANFRIVKKKASPACIRKVFGKEMEVTAKPVSTTIKIRPTKHFVKVVLIFTIFDLVINPLHGFSLRKYVFYDVHYKLK